MHMKSLNGEYVAPTDRAEAIASYLEVKHVKQWSNDFCHPLERLDNIQDLSHSFNIGLLTIAELDDMRKQPQPDYITMELFKWIDSANRSWLLDLINVWY